MISRNIIVLGAAAAAGIAALSSVLIHNSLEKKEAVAVLGELQAKAEADARAQEQARKAKKEADKAVEGEVYYDEDEADFEAADREGMTPAELAKLPEWAREFSKLSKEARAQFLLSFSIAKHAYSQESWAECTAILNECELIFDGSPNVWNLRACALIELGDYAAAEPYVARVLAYQADDPIGLLNLANIQMAKPDFPASAETLQKLLKVLRNSQDHDQVDLITFRLLLCHLMQRQEMEARDLVTDIDPLHDSPLYYCAQAAFAIYKGDSETARRALDSATRIYGESPVLNAYRKWLQRSNLRDKYLEGQELESHL